MSKQETWRIAKFNGFLVAILAARNTRKHGWVFKIRCDDGTIIQNVPENELTKPKGI